MCSNTHAQTRCKSKNIVYNMYHRKCIKKGINFCFHNDKPDHHSPFFLPLDFLPNSFEFGFAYQK